MPLKPGISVKLPFSVWQLIMFGHVLASALSATCASHKMVYCGVSVDAFASSCSPVSRQVLSAEDVVVADDRVYSRVASASAAAALTVTVQLALLPPAIAVTVQPPALLAVTVPFTTVAMPVGVTVQMTLLLVASAGSTVAVRVLLSPSFRVRALLLRLTLCTGISSLPPPLLLHSVRRAFSCACMEGLV